MFLFEISLIYYNVYVSFVTAYYVDKYLFAFHIPWHRQVTFLATHINYRLTSSWTARPFKMVPISCPETSVTECISTLSNIPEGRRSQGLIST